MCATVAQNKTPQYNTFIKTPSRSRKLYQVHVKNHEAVPQKHEK